MLTPLFNDKILFPSLKELEFQSININEIWDGQLPSTKISLQNLTMLAIDKCDILKYAVSYSLLKCLGQLKRLTVSNCGGMEEVIGGKEEEQPLLFPKLQFLKLHNLPKLKRLGSQEVKLHPNATPTQQPLFNQTVLFPNLEELVLSSIPNLEMLWHPPMENSLQNLAELTVRHCDNLKYVFSYSIIKCFGQLQRLTIYCCPEMRRVIGGVMEKDQHILSPKLKDLKLYGNDTLQGFCWNNLIECPLLRTLSIGGCKQLRTFVYQYFPRYFPRTEAALFDKKVLFPSLLYLEIKGLPYVQKIWHDQLATGSFCELRDLTMEKCDWVKSIIPPSLLGRFQKLRSLNVKSCILLKEVFEVERSSSTSTMEISFQFIDPRRFTFSNLRSVNIDNCYSLKTVFPWSIAANLLKLEKLIVGCALNDEDPEIMRKREDGEAEAADASSKLTWPNLYWLQVPRPLSVLQKVNCCNLVFLSDIDGKYENATCLSQYNLLGVFPKIKVLKLENFNAVFDGIPFGFLQRFPKLETLTVNESSFEELFSCDGVAAENVILPQLKYLEVKGLWNVRHVWEQQNDIHVVPLLRNLERLQLSDCYRLVNFAPSSASFPNLTSLILANCDLSSIFTVRTAKSLRKLIKVRYCAKVTEIIGKELGDEIEDGEIIFDNLQSCVLDRLRNLTSFCYGNFPLSFPSLTELIVETCPRMRAFSSGPLSTPKLKQVYLSDFKSKSWWEGDLNGTIQQLSIEMVGFEDIWSLQLSEFPELKDKWHGPFPMEKFSRLRKLVVDDCSFFPSAVPYNLSPCLGNLTELKVRNCDSLVTVFDFESLEAEAVPAGKLLPELWELCLNDLPNLQFLCNKNPKRSLAFQSLCWLTIDNCNNLRHVFTTSMALGLVKLCRIEIRNCVRLEEIITKEGEEEVETHDQVRFPKLARIILQSLPNLIDINSGEAILNLGSLYEISIKDCPHMTSFISSLLRGQVIRLYSPPLYDKVTFSNLEDLRLEWNDTMEEIAQGNQVPPEFFGKLKVLELMALPNNCTSLSLSFLQRLPNLQSLVINNALFQEIIAHDEIIDDDHHARLLQKLRALKLSRLPKLLHFTRKESLLCSLFRRLETLEVLECNIGNILVPSSVSFKNLETLNVSKCDNLLHLVTDTVARSLLRLRSMTIRECGKIEQIVLMKENRENIQSLLCN